ncbi:MAG: 30S ribosomal protein S20 [Thermodesulfovibrionales bacterium]
MPAKPAPKKNLSALKRVRQAEKRRLRNRAVRTTIKTLTKNVEAAVNNKSSEAAQKMFQEAAKVITRAVSKGIIHKNTASRKISRLARLANTLRDIAPETP